MLTCFKSVIRRPTQHVLLVLFLGIVSFGFITHVAEYLAVTQAVDKLSGYYKAIGYLNSNDGEVTDGARFLRDNELIAINDVQRACSGTLHGLYNSDLDGNTSKYGNGYRVSEFFVLGELIEKKYRATETLLSAGLEHYTLKFRVSERLYGYPDYAEEDNIITVLYYPDETDADWEAAFDTLQPNAVYAVKAYSTDGFTFLLRQAIPGGDWFLPATDSRIAEVVNADAVQEINRHRLYLDGTRDMSSLPFTQAGSHDGYLVDGRWLTAADNDTQNPVCVILEGFAETRGLSVGDSLTISMRDEPQLVHGYYPEGTVVDEADFIDDPTTTFTIVGIFNRTIFTQESIMLSSYSLTVYVPNSCIPAEYGASWNNYESVYGVGYSFVLNRPDDQDTFLQQYRKQLEDMGCTVTFVDNGWDAFSASAKSLARSTAFSTAMFAVIHLMTLILAAIFYFRLHQKEFSIARALGVSSARAIRWHLAPATLLGMIGIGVGSVLAWHRALGQIQVTLSTLIHDGQELNVQLSAGIPVLLCVISLVMLMFAALVCYAALSRHSVMDILYETRKNETRKNETHNNEMRKNWNSTRKQGMSPDVADIAKISAAPALPKGNGTFQADVSIPPESKEIPPANAPIPVPSAKNSVPYQTRFTCLARFTRRHISRSKGRTFLTLIVPVIFILALGWIQRSIDRAEQSIIDAYENVSVEAEILKRNSASHTTNPGFISDSAVKSILATGFVKESELVAPATNARLTRVTDATDTSLASAPATVNNVISKFTLCGITDASHLNRETKNVAVPSGDGKVTYQDGWDASMFEADYDPETTPCPVVIPETIRANQNISFGDELSLVTGLQKMTVVVRGSYTGRFNGLGSLSDDSSGDVVLMPHSSMQKLYDGKDIYYSVAKFVLEPTRNRELDTFRTAAEQIMKHDTYSLLAIRIVIWDEELRQVIEPLEKNLALMKLFYPVAQLAIIVATGIITLLSLMQKTKTAFLLHILGIPSRTVQVVLGSEQVLLGIIGSIIGTLVIIASGNWSIRTVPCVLVYLLGLMIGTVAGSISLTRNQNHA